MMQPDAKRRPVTGADVQTRATDQATEITLNVAPVCVLACSPSCSYTCPILVGQVTQ
jgi:hypothetical protein